MGKFLCLAVLVLCGVTLQAAPGETGNIERGGAEGGTDTALNGSGVVFTTDDFKLRLTTRVQFRLTYQNEVANGSDGTNGRDFMNFRVRRAKSTFSGHIFAKEFQYSMTLSWTGSNTIEVAYFKWAAHQYANITAGQAKLQWNWEEASSSGSMQFVDRSHANEVFNQDFAKGITVDGRIGDDVPWLKYWAGIYNGVLKGNSDFRNADQPIRGDSFSNLVDAEMMLNLRLETHPLGEVKRGMYDARGEEKFQQVLIAVGLGVNWFTSGYDAGAAFSNSGSRADTAAGTPASGRFRTNQDTLAIVLDAHLRWHGLSVDVEFFWRHTEFHNRGANDFSPRNRNGIANLNDSGFSAQVAYFILPEEFNVGVRFNVVNADEFWSGGSSSRLYGIRPDTSELGISANYYVQGNNLKVTFDVLMVSQQLPVAAGGSLSGVYNSPPSRGAFGGSGENSDYNDLWIIRLQLQWVF